MYWSFLSFYTSKCNIFFTYPTLSSTIFNHLIFYDDSDLSGQVLMRNPISVHRAAIDIDSTDDVIRRLAAPGFYGNIRFAVLIRILSYRGENIS